MRRPMLDIDSPRETLEGVSNALVSKRFVCLNEGGRADYIGVHHNR